ncbi:DNA repair protein RecO [Patescibacteria group bacterium]|nr:DNA repair protein RecO [Patescibacteria group bacterium]MBU1683616.1 DNA repair protein RecO [Patescibacteria group bacterium]MBU1935228.1 DNA repair protein RecO [Patescibacteria group bacterium]
MSKHIKTEGIILRRINLNDADQILTVLTKDLGKISVMAKSSRRIKSKFCGKLELFYEVKVTVFQGRNLGYLNESEPINTWGFADSDLRTKSILFYIAELTNKLIQDEQQIDGVYKLLQETLDHIDHNNEKSELILYAFIIKLFGLTGFMAPWDRCARSNVKLNLTEPLYFDLHNGSVVKSGYNSPADPRLTPPLIKWVSFMQKYPFAAITKVAPNKGEKTQVWYMIKMMLENILNYPIKSEEFLGIGCNF